MSDTSSLSYRADIDGLRALAVVGVLAFHAFPKAVTGGFSGVDVFFVISGFLITSIIAREIRDERFSLLDFYARRIKRLFPALILVLAATACLGWFYLLAHEYRALGRHIATGAAYVINFTLRAESGYFDTDASEKPLLHLWSLAVEEQFYLVWPLVLMVMARRRYLLGVIVAIFAASFASNMAHVSTNGAAAFYLPQNRFWELAMGAMLAIAPSPFSSPMPVVQNVLSVAGLVLIGGGYWGLNAQMQYPGAWALIPCCGAVCLIAAGPAGIVNRLVLANPLAVGIGLISYPLYLWHWPLLSFQSILGINAVPARLVALAAATVLAVFTYLYAERPIRHARGRAYAVPLFALALMFVPLGLLARTQILRPRLSAEAYSDVAAASRDWTFPKGLKPVVKGKLMLQTAGSGRRRVLMFGDSNIQQYWPRVEKLLENGLDATVTFATGEGCLPIPGVRSPARPACDRFADAVDDLLKTEKFDAVVTGAIWPGYFGKSRYVIGENGGVAITYGQPGFETAMTAFDSMLQRIRGTGADLWLLLSIPAGGSLAPQTTLSRSIWGELTLLPSQLPRGSFERPWAPVRDRISGIARQAGARIIDPLDSLCDAALCPGRTVEGKLIYKDTSHLRASFVREHASFIDPAITGQSAPGAATHSSAQPH